MPAIGDTEKEAIEAGDLWWEKELFCGNPHWEKLFSEPAPTLTIEEQRFLSNQVDTLCSMLNDWEIVHEIHNIPDHIWNYLKKEGFFGLVIPKQYGGLGFSVAALSVIIVRVATRSISVAVTLMVPNTLGPGELLLQYGTDEQKQCYLPCLATGEEMPCFALTAPDAGSDAGAIPDKGIICYGEFEGKNILGMRVTWDKRYITLAPVATLLGLAIHLYDPDHLLSSEEDRGITLCLIPTSHPGVEIGHRHYPMQLAFLNGPTRGKDVFIPMNWIIGEEPMIGKGWRMLMGSLSAGRAISLPALATACSKMAYRHTGVYARLRQQFNVPIASFEGIQEALGYIAGFTYTLEACRTMTIGALQQHIKPAIASAIAKYQMTELSRRSVQHAMDIHGGHAIQTGPDNILAPVYNSIPISITVEGANILTRNLIIFGQGAIRCHPYLYQEMIIILSKKPDLNQFDQLLMSHVGYFVSHFIRSLGYGLTGGRFIYSSIKNRTIKKHHKQLTRMSTALAFLSDISLMLLGGQLKRKERVSARLGDILSELYLASAALKRYHDTLSLQSKEECDHATWALQSNLHNIQIAIDGLLYNFPIRFLGKLLRFIVFPFGTAYRLPSDRLHAKLALSMTTPSDFRNRLTQYCYIGRAEHTQPDLLENALLNVAPMDELLKKVNRAVRDKLIPGQYSKMQRIAQACKINVLTEEEARHLSAFESLREAIIKVNEFSFDLSKVIV
ncbi:MAG: hypothetical protein A3F43_05830 [Gammaproteobacteria bacterium RIFCSPHIGHO2_12_FULL_42_10]|nr:MAG: hypothetical protein A3F43_05830 [Gammaproteobacteria bacterium RIFCSPHIGHO2_12_FULL_42_10]